MERWPGKSSSVLYHDVFYPHKKLQFTVQYLLDTAAIVISQFTSLLQKEKTIDSPHNRDQPKLLPTRRIRRFLQQLTSELMLPWSQIIPNSRSSGWMTIVSSKKSLTAESPERKIVWYNSPSNVVRLLPIPIQPHRFINIFIYPALHTSQIILVRPQIMDFDITDGGGELEGDSGAGGVGN